MEKELSLIIELFFTYFTVDVVDNYGTNVDNFCGRVYVCE